jgi:cardiolipin synthase (CMP-forming)
MGNKDGLDRVITIPNILTLVRFLLVGVMAYVFFAVDPRWAMVVYLFAAATDLVDGYIARKFNQISNVGKVMDPIADKTMTVTALICMLINGYLTVGVLIVIIVKEALMIIGGILIYRVFKKVVVANLYGKISAAAYFLAIMLMYLHEYVTPFDSWFMYLAVAMNIVSIFQYGYINIVLEARKRRDTAKA